LIRDEKEGSFAWRSGALADSSAAYVLRRALARYYPYFIDV